MTKNTKTTQASGAKLGDAELILLASGGQRDDHLIAIPESMKPVTRQRAAANLVKRGLVEERVARRNDPAWREDEGGRFTLGITAAGLAAIGIEDEPRKPAASHPAPVEATQPREGTKGALVVSLLSRPSGASIGELIDATGWLPHTTRAALTGLRKRGYDVLLDRTGEGSGRYRIALPEPVTKTRRSRPAASRQAAA